MNNDMLDIGQEYVEFMKEETKKLNPDILLYGSAVYGKITSDLDILFIVQKYRIRKF